MASTPHPGWWRRITPVPLVLGLAIACSEESAVTGQGGHGIEATVTPIYDSTGQPQYSYYSANSQITVTTDSSFEPAGASYTRSYFEEYSWTTPQNRWNNHNTYGSGTTPFSGVAPQLDVANAQLTFGVTQPTLHLRSGAALQPPTTKPPLQSDTTPMPPIHLPSGGPPGSPTAMRASLQTGTSVAATGASAGSDESTWRGAAVERLVVSPQTKARVLARLRGAFAEAPGLGGTIHFSQVRGDNQVDVTFNPGLGAITEMTTSVGGHRVSRTTYRYDRVPSQGVFTLSEVVTRLFGPDGSATRTFTKKYNDLTVR